MRKLGLFLAGVLVFIQLAGCVAEVAYPPPPGRYEYVGPAPYYGAVWIGGFWAWDGRWLWRPGHWARRPYPGAVWAPGRWHEREGRWRWRPGRWMRR